MILQIHKNDLAPFFLKNRGKKCKIGKEKFIRWIDVPEYIRVNVDPEEEMEHRCCQKIRKIIYTEKCDCAQCRSDKILADKINEIIDHTNDLEKKIIEL